MTDNHFVYKIKTFCHSIGKKLPATLAETLTKEKISCWTQWCCIHIRSLTNADLVIKSVSIWHALMRQEARILTISRDNRVPRKLRRYPNVLTGALGFYIWAHRQIWLEPPAFHAGVCGFEPRCAQAWEFILPARGSSCWILKEWKVYFIWVGMHSGDCSGL